MLAAHGLGHLSAFKPIEADRAVLSFLVRQLVLEAVIRVYDVFDLFWGQFSFLLL
jgi:hypothetical protein